MTTLDIVKMAKPFTEKQVQKESSIPAYLSKYLTTLTIDQWVNDYQPVPINRAHELRVPKMKKKFILKADSLKWVALAVVEKKFNYYDSDGALVNTIYPGSYRLDGNTRAEFWRMYPEHRISDPLLVKKFYINSQEQLDLEYEGLDNKTAAMTGADHITSAMRLLNLSYRHPKLAKGSIAEPLKYAFGDDKAMAVDKVKFFQDELKIIDDYNLLDFTKNMGKMGLTHILTCMLICLKTWTGPQQKRLIDGLIEFNKISDNIEPDKKQENGLRPIDTYFASKKVNPLALIWKEYYSKEDQSVLGQQRHLTGIKGSSKYDDCPQQFNFICYLMKRYVEGKNIVDTGIYQDNYAGVYYELADWE